MKHFSYIVVVFCCYHRQMREFPEKPPPGVSHVEIAESQSGQRIDNFLITRLKGVPKSHIYRVIRKGRVRVNKKRIRPEYKIKAGDCIRIPPVRQGEEPEQAQPGADTARQLNERILYEDDRLLILNKPSGMAVHGGSGLSFGVIEALRALRPNAPFLELAHRLDRDTSGCLIIAKKRSVLRTLHTLLREGEVAKHYLALVKGRWQGGQQKIDVSLQKNTLKSGERMVRVNEEGKRSISIFKPVKLYADTSLLEIKLMTGRTHQIRVHAQYIGHPVAGDSKYGDKVFNRTLKKLGLKRLFLHASRLDFKLPDDGSHIKITAPLDPDLDALVKQLAGQSRQD